MNTLAVIGAGTMGAGIAQLAAQHGWGVHLIDVSRDVVDRGAIAITRRLDRLVEKGRLTSDERDEAVARVHPSTDIAGLDDVDLAIEAVVERPDVKRDVFAALERACPAGAVLATNTSSLAVRDIAAGVGDPSRVVGMHFFNPAPLMPLVEVISTDRSRADCVDRAFDVAASWGKTPVRAKDTPGFIVNRVARGFYLEALRLLDEGVAGVGDVDHVMRDLAGFRMGPFELMDLVGLDVNFAVSCCVYERMGTPVRLTPHPIQARLVETGQLGRKTGRGFYDYATMPPKPACRRDGQRNGERAGGALPSALGRTVAEFASAGGIRTDDPAERFVFTRILAAILNEAGFARDDDIATPADIDTAMRKGTNYPHGPLAWADRIGHAVVRDTLRALDTVCGDGRYTPARCFG